MTMKRIILSMGAVAMIAMACHGANAAYAGSLGEKPAPPWDKMDEAHKQARCRDVLHIAENPDLGDEAAHKSWMEAKLKEGWVFGEQKDAEKKTHPCLVPYAELPKEQQFKDALFRAIVLSLAPVLADYYPDAEAVPDPRIAELEDALAKSKAKTDNATAAIAKLKAGAIVAVAAAANAAVEEVEIKRPKPGAQLKLARKLPTSLHVSDALSNGSLFQVVLADSDGRALDVRPLLGSGSMLIARGNDGPLMELLLADAIDIDPSNTSVAIREAWLLDTSGHGLSSCRLSSDLVGGGGLAAQIPARSFVFRFDDPKALAA